METLLENPANDRIDAARVGSSALLGFFVRDCVNVAVTKIVDDVSWNRFDLQQAWDLMSVEERMRFAKNTRDAIDASVKKAVEEVENSVRAQLGGAPTSVLWGPAGLLAATMRALQDSEMPNDKVQGHGGNVAQ